MSCDVFFLSYDEDFADENYELVQLVAPHAKHVRGIKGIFNAHKECARQSLTKNFYVIDADAILERGFYFDFEPSDDIEWWPGVPQTACVHVWRSRNPINGLLYGYGGVKLFPKQALLALEDWHIDFTNSASGNFKAMPQVSNITGFNTSPYNTWKSAFRECTKLSSGVIKSKYDGKVDENTEKRLEIWCTVGEKELYGTDAIRGANEGRDFGKKNAKNLEELNKINDFEWLREQFDKK